MHNEETHVQDRTVYVKMIAVSDLPLEVREQAEGLNSYTPCMTPKGSSLRWSVTASSPLASRAIMTMRP